ncbi:MAG: GNAT family N-acetyltransferase [Acidimicrobiia bacterium]
MAQIRYEWRGDFVNDEVNALHADAFEHLKFDDDWRTLVAERSLGWVTARGGENLVGFVNVIWDGLVHAWIQDEMVSTDSRHRGIGVRLIEMARDRAKVAGCEWLHVDFDDHLRPFYLDAAGFTPTNGGLINLTELD